MWSIEVFADKLAAKPVETYYRDRGSIGDWLKMVAPRYRPGPDQPISIELNGVVLDPSQWERVVPEFNDRVAVVVEPKGFETFLYVAIGLAVVSAAYTLYMLNNLPEPPTDPGASTSIYDPNAQGNKARLNDVVEEHFGFFPCFPSYLNQPRRIYIDDEIWLYLCLSRGVGKYNVSEVLIGNTPISDGGDIDMLLADPDADITSHLAYLNIYTSPEVGATSGTAGIELAGAVETVEADDNTYVTFSNDDIAIYSNSTGSIVRQTFPYAVGAQFSVSSAGGNNGTYEVQSITNDVAEVTKVGDATWTSWDTPGNDYDAVLTFVGGVSSGEWAGPYYACPENETTDKIWLNFALNSGLVEYSNDGAAGNRTVEVEYEYSLNDGSTWTSGTFSRTEATADALGNTVEVSLSSSGRPLVRVRRTTAETDSSRIRDTIEWVGLQSELSSKTSYPFSTLLLGIRGTNNLAQTAENKIRVDQTRYLMDYRNGTWIGPAATESITAAALYVIKQAGYTDAEIDLAEFDRLGQLWDSRGDYFAAAVDRDQVTWETLREILAVGYSEPTIDAGLISPVRDEARSAIETLYPVEVQVGDGLEREIILWDPSDVTDGVEVEYFDRDTAKPATVLYTLGAEAGERPEKVKAFGICDKTRAWRFGARKRRQRVYQTTKFNFTTEQSALVSRYGSYIGITDGIPSQPQSGLVEAVSGNLVTLDKEVNWSSGTHYIGFRLPSGALSGPFVATQVSDTQVSVTGTLPALYTRLDGTYQIPTVWLFGPSSDWVVQALVTSIRPGPEADGSPTVDIEAVNYDSRVYLDDDNEP